MNEIDSFWFACEICGKERPNNKISVRTFDNSLKYDLPVGTVKRHVNYCNDNDKCKVGVSKLKQHEDI